jgi:protease-4
MLRLAVLGFLLAGTVGCLRPIRTDDRIHIDGPVAAELVPTSNAHPIVAMPVEGGCAACKGPHVAIIDVDGLLLNINITGPYSAGDNPVDLFREKLNAAAGDPATVAVVVRINSPGGSVTASDVMWRELRCFRENTGKPVVACLMDLGTSGAYYLATACDQIVAHPTSVTGGIGVVLNLYNLQDAMNVFNITTQSIKAGKNIDIGSVTQAMPRPAKAILQSIADEQYERFCTIVRQQRPAVDPADATTFDGRVFSATQAWQRGLVDRIGYLADALCMAREMAHQSRAGAVLLHREGDVARTPYATTPNVPLQFNLIPFSLPGVDRTKLPTFLYLWEPDPTLERISGR